MFQERFPPDSFKSSKPTSSFRIQFSNITQAQKKFRVRTEQPHAPVWDLPNVDDFLPDSLSISFFAYLENEIRVEATLVINKGFSQTFLPISTSDQQSDKNVRDSWITLLLLTVRSQMHADEIICFGQFPDTFLRNFQG